MAVFDELSRTRKMEDPEERRPEDLRRGNKKWGKNTKVKETSVTAQRYIIVMSFVKFFAALVVLAVTVFLIYKGVTIFIPSDF